MSAYLLLVIAGLVAGAMNAVAGGGTFLTFPALVFAGVPSLVANASNSVALFPASFASAWAYRRDFRQFENLSLPAMLIASVLGGAVGASLLLLTPQRTFDALVPWLLAVATAMFAFGPRITRVLQGKVHLGRGALIASQVVVGIYGGYFGGAMGIIMLAVWSVFGLKDLNAMNAVKTLLSGTINAVAVVLFISAGKIAWPQTVAVLFAALVGGYFGARIARRMNPLHVRRAVIAISVVVTAVFFLRS